MPQSETVRRLKKNVGVARYLRELRDNGKLKRSRARTGEAARLAGYTQDVVQMDTGSLVSEHAARIRYGAQWFKYVKPTGYEMLTSAGSMALQELEQSG